MEEKIMQLGKSGKYERFLDFYDEELLLNSDCYVHKKI